MDNGIHFIAGLPRSGSTLLAGILRQNPRFHAGMTSPVGSMYMALESAMSRRNETAVFIDDTQRRAVLQGLFGSYYEQIHRDKVVFDTNRAWCTKLPALGQLFPNARVICCVRDIGWIMDSVERLVRRNAFELSGMFGFEPGGTVYTRVNRIAASDGVYTAQFARLLLILGWWLLAGELAATVAEGFARMNLLGQLVTWPVDWARWPASWSVSWPVVWFGLGLVIFARVMRIGAGMRADLEGTV